MAAGLVLTVDAILGQTIGLVSEEGSVRQTLAATVTSLVPPLSTEIFVDVGTAEPVATQDGSIAQPFSTIGAAAAVASNFDTLTLIAGDYSAEVPPVFVLDLQLTSPVPQWAAGAAVDQTWLVANGFLVNLPNLTGLALALVNVTVDQVTANRVSLAGCIIGTSITSAGIVTASNTRLPSSVVATADDVTADSCQIGFGGAAGITTGGTVVRLSNCRTQLALTVTFSGAAGQLQVDASTNHYLQTNGITIVNGALVVTSRQARETLAVVVPAVAAGAVGYVSTAFIAELASIPQFAPLVGNPQADLVAAGAGGGFVNCWADAAGSVRCSFLGPLAGGAVAFTFART